MRLLLTAVNAKYIHSNPAVYSLKAAAGELSAHVELAEFTINHRTEEILREIYQRKPDVLLFSCYIWNIRQVKELILECRKVLPETPIWLGGPEVSFSAEKLLKEYPQVTGILTGEGEESFRELAECYVNKKNSWERIPGAVFRRKGTDARDAEDIQVNAPGRPLNLSALPFPYQDLTDFTHRILYYESSRGCPFSCSYCLSSIEKQVRFRDLTLVRQELQYFLDAKVPQVKFVDRTFNCSHRHAMAVWTYLLEHDNGITNFHFEIAADLLNEEELQLMAGMRPGLIQLEIGVQSTNLKTLSAIHRKTDLENLKNYVEKIRRMGTIHQHLDLIAGLPYEDYRSFGESFNQVFAMKPDQLQLGFLKVLDGTVLKEEAQTYGIVCREEAPYEVLYTRWISFSEILQLKAIEEMVEIYYNSHQFQYTLERLIPVFPSPFVFFEKLAGFYEQEELKGRNHSRIQRYEILLAFIRTVCSEEENRYRELLTVDLYRREKLKSRPDFGTDQSPYQKQIRKIRSHVGKRCHVEVLTAWSYRPVYLVFDYEKRDPLTKDALVTRFIETEEEVV